MKIVFDTEACKKNNKDADLLLYLFSIYSGTKITLNTFEKARQQGWLRFKQMYNGNQFPEYVELSDDAKFLVESIMADSNNSALKSDNSDDRFNNLANKLRELYPQGKKPGVQYMWRDSTSIIANRLKKFFLKYGEHSDDEIIEATKKYVNSFNGNYTYMQLLKYFIWKNKVTGGELIEGRLVGEVEPQSQLAAFIENNDSLKTVNADWELSLK
jgi:hypothetical protein